MSHLYFSAVSSSSWLVRASPLSRLRIPKSRKTEKALLSKHLLISHFWLSSGHSESHGQAQSQCDKGLREWGQGGINHWWTISATVNHTLGSPRWERGYSPFWRSSESGATEVREGWMVWGEGGKASCCRTTWSDLTSHMWVEVLHVTSRQIN